MFFRKSNGISKRIHFIIVFVCFCCHNTLSLYLGSGLTDGLHGVGSHVSYLIHHNIIMAAGLLMCQFRSSEYIYIYVRIFCQVNIPVFSITDTRDL